MASSPPANMDIDTPPKAKRRYFAYGSNMSMKQMKARCPGSTFIGRGVLHGYKWLINERGYANIIESGTLIKARPAEHIDVPDEIIEVPYSSVHGLVYELNTSDTDEFSLDIHEGVRFGAYEKMPFDIDLYPFAVPVSPPDIYAAVSMRDVATKEMGGYEKPPDNATNVLVYTSYRFVCSGKTQPDYFQRMMTAVSDAYAIGVPEDYLAREVVPLIANGEPQKAAKCMQSIKARIDDMEVSTED